MRWALKPTSTLAMITSARGSHWLLRPALLPAVEMAGFDSLLAPGPAGRMAGFDSLSPSEPVVEMAGFAFPARRKYRPTVSRSIPSSRATRRLDHPPSAKLYIVVCRLTLRSFDMPLTSRSYRTDQSCFYSH